MSNLQWKPGSGAQGTDRMVGDVISMELTVEAKGMGGATVGGGTVRHVSGEETGALGTPRRSRATQKA